MTPIEKRIREAVIQLWSTHHSFTQRDIAAATATSCEGPLPQRSVAYYFSRWEDSGILRTQTAVNGNSGAARAFSWGAPSDATLRCGLNNALSTGALPEATQRHIRTAVRTVLQLPPRCEDDAILAASEQVPAPELYEFPERVLEAYKDRNPAGERIAFNLRSAMRLALRGAAMGNLVPVVFPRIWAEDPWEEAKWQYFHASAPNLARLSIRTYRCNWQKYGEEARELFGRDTTPDQMTAERVTKLRRHLIGTKGKRYLARQINTILNYVGREYAEGPFAAKWEDESLTIGYNGRVNAGYLVDSEGRGASDGNWNDFLRILRDNGFGQEWTDFFAWYHDYSTLSRADILRDPRFPSRPSKRVLKARTLVKRVVAVRAWGYQTLLALRDLEGFRPADITPEMAFGTYGPHIVRRLIGWWTDRAERGEVSHATSDGLVGILKGGMMTARALYDRRRHEKGVRSIGEGGRALRVVDEEAMVKDAVEEALWQTYIECRNQIDAIEEERKQTPDGHVKTTLKDIQRIIRATPPRYWESILDEIHRRVREAKDTGRDSGFRYHRLVMLGFLLGLMISTGFRISEVTHLRLGSTDAGEDRQYGPKRRRERYIGLRPGDRKNKKKHGAFLRERYCPLWLEAEYLERCRPFFLDHGGTPEHDWLIVDGTGRPYGCSEEKDNGTGRDDVAHSYRIAALRDAWIDQLMGIAADLKLPIPLWHGEFAPHVIRNSFGYAIFQIMGKEDAANYLGDEPDSVEETYASCSGEHVDVSEALVEGVRLIKAEIRREKEAAPSAPVAPASPSSVAGGYSTQLALLMQARNEGRITDSMLDAALADLNRHHGLAA